MGATLSQIFSVLTEPAGSLIYHLILVFSIAGALQSSFVHWRSSEFPQARRTIFGLGMLLVAQIVLFLVSGIGIQGLINLPLFLPPLDRAVTLFSLVWLIWLWAFPEPSRPADAGTWLLSLLVLSALGLSLAAYSTQSTFPSYNLTASDSYWQLASIGFSLLGLFLLAVRRPNGWGYGIAVFLLSFAGHLLYIIFGRVDGDFPGAVRLAHMAAYPILLTLPLAVRRMIDNGFSSPDGTFMTNYFSMLVVIAAVLALASACRYYYVITLGERIVADLRRGGVSPSCRHRVKKS